MVGGKSLTKKGEEGSIQWRRQDGVRAHRDMQGVGAPSTESAMGAELLHSPQLPHPGIHSNSNTCRASSRLPQQTNDGAWQECPTTNSVWMGLPAHLFLWGPDLTQKVFIYCCQKHLGWYKNVLEDTTKWSSSLNKGHFTLEYLKKIVCYVKKSSGLAKGKFLTGYVSWKGPLKTTEQGLFYSNTLKMESGCRLHALQSLAVLTSRDKDFRFKRKMHFWKTLCYKKENFKCFHCCWSSSEEDTSKSQASWETTWGSCRTHWTHFLSVLKQEYQWTGSLFLNHLIARSWLGKNKKWEAAV